ncbi:tetratricopeptide repeat protein [Rhodopirellula europaea]|uniref:tetratricopeptide repeat protein n=1 Tax=Rhodopirellula europaea TaxID=1263866 RepID=UPI001F1EA36D|nr:tetratricopeptide repeat protein [Rhodopirellula europaea]
MAIELYERVLAEFPNDVDTHLNLAHALLSRKQFDRAAEHFATALSLAPNDERARSGMVVINQLKRTSN